MGKSSTLCRLEKNLDCVMEIRPMIADDLKRGLLETLSSLAEVELTFEEAVVIFQKRLREKIMTYVALIEGRVVGTATLIAEQKFIHSGGVVGHVEDVATHPDYQNLGIGAALIQQLIEEAERFGCYKLVLQCKPELMRFYEKAGFREWTKNMRLDLIPV